MKTIKKIVLIAIILFTISLNAQEKRFKVDVIGKGTPVLLFPGFTCTGDVWKGVVGELSKTNECHIFTFAGFGGVPAIEKPWLPKIKEGLEEYIAKNNLEKATLIGHSLGGSLALWLATEDLYDFNKIIVLDALPSVGALMMPNFKSEHVVYDNPYNKQMLEMNAENFEKQAVQFATGMSLNKEKHNQIKTWILEADRETYVYGYTDLMKLDLREDVAKIKAPVFILGATHPFGEENAKRTYTEQYKNLSNYRIEYVKDSAHFIMYDQPEYLIKTIKSELK
ncbi:alpha/beta fold hydrolase [Flavivirga algicola]|uniref:Alpha/beta hydrolase n=1 Tax=Flavivirga algicola TaxID=2729136 RepID=A0ABX1S3S3_9FLAO|nr:alpha/beta hydrolase [Flavivirga algicola]NMH89287.1 alpha/beta hydrolase [Flavivirga algicola]